MLFFAHFIKFEPVLMQKNNKNFVSLTYSCLRYNSDNYVRNWGSDQRLLKYNQVNNYVDIIRTAKTTVTNGAKVNVSYYTSKSLIFIFCSTLIKRQHRIHAIFTNMHICRIELSEIDTCLIRNFLKNSSILQTSSLEQVSKLMPLG